MSSSNAPATIQLSLVSHTNAGKTTLARTLLGRDIGEVRDAPHVTDISSSHVLLQSPEGDVLRLWDTPGFGDSARLAKRLRTADNPVGWLLREVWDRYRSRPLWCSQQAVRTARDAADVVLYLVNAAEDPADAGYVGHEMQILTWVGKPVIVLLNQAGPPRPTVDEMAEVQRWRTAVASFRVVRDVLPLDAFARCWVQEGLLFERVRAALPSERHPAMDRLTSVWRARSLERFAQSMDTLVRQLSAAVHDREPVLPGAPSERPQRLLQALGLGKNAADRERDQAMARLAQRADEHIRAGTDALITLHGLEGHAATVVLERLRTNYSLTEPLSAGKAAAAGGIASGALTGLMADLAAGGLTLGAGVVAGTILGALGGAGVARARNALHGADEPAVTWSPSFLDASVRSALLRYLAVAHFGRGRGAYAQSEAPVFWQDVVAQAVESRAATFHALWMEARATRDRTAIVPALRALLLETAADVLDRLYPGACAWDDPDSPLQRPDHEPST